MNEQKIYTEFIFYFNYFLNQSKKYIKIKDQEYYVAFQKKIEITLKVNFHRFYRAFKEMNNFQ